MKSKSKPPRGTYKRDRAAVAFRLNPLLAEWYATAADKAGCSRNDLMERSLAAIRNVLDDAATWEGEGLTPTQASAAVGSAFVAELVRLGLASEVLKESLELWMAEQRRAAITLQRTSALNAGSEGAK